MNLKIKKRKEYRRITIHPAPRKSPYFSTGSVVYFVFGIISLILCFHLLALEDDFQEEKSTHFIVYYKKSVDRSFIKEIIDTAEEYYDEIANNLGFHRYNFWLWDNRAKIYIFPDKTSYQKETGQPDWSGGCASYQDKTIWTYPHAVGFFDSILPHELGHIIFREFVGSNRKIPLWFEEGIASYQEKSKRYAATNTVKELKAENQLMTLEELSKIKGAHQITDSELADKFYAQAVSIIYFLINKYGEYRFAILCRNLGENMSLDKALNETYYNIRSSDDLYKMWLRELK